MTLAFFIYINFYIREYHYFNISEFQIKFKSNWTTLSYSCHRNDRIINVKIIHRPLYLFSKWNIIIKIL